MKTWFSPEDFEVVLLPGEEGRPVIDLLYAIEVERGLDVADHLEAYLDHPVFFAAMRNGELVGGIKLVMGNPEGLPIHEVWPELNLVGRTDVADLSLLALRGGRRGDLYAVGSLINAVWVHCRECGVSEVWAELPPRNIKLYQRMGFPFEVMGEKRDYWGTPHVPSRVVLDKAAEVVAERTAISGLYQRVVGTTPASAASSER